MIFWGISKDNKLFRLVMHSHRSTIWEILKTVIKTFLQNWGISTFTYQMIFWGISKDNKLFRLVMHSHRSTIWEILKTVIKTFLQNWGIFKRLEASPCFIKFQQKYNELKIFFHYVVNYKKMMVPWHLL